MEHGGEVMDRVLAELALPPLVTIEGGIVTLYDRDYPGFKYDFLLGDAVDALSWVRQITPKQWVTKAHIEAFVSLALRELAANRA